MGRVRPIKKWLLVVLCLVWCTLIGMGMKILWTYKSTPGSPGESYPLQWPQQSAIKRSSDRMTLVMFGHPMCPCTRASLTELIKLAEQFRQQIKVYVVFSIFDDISENWEKTNLVERAVSIPELSVVLDPDGIESRRFGVETSGHVVLYDQEANLLFNGGITALRGHEGDSLGKKRIVSLLATGIADKTNSPVFGCALHSKTKDTVLGGRIEQTKHGSH